MQIIHQVAHGTCLRLAAAFSTSTDSPKLVMVSGGGGGSLKLDGAFAGIWIPLRGRLQLGSDVILYPGEARVTEPEPKLDIVGRDAAIWLAIVGTPAAWRTSLTCSVDELELDPPLLPARHAADHDLRRLAIALIRTSSDAEREASAEALIARLMTLQSEFAPIIGRCGGRTYAQRRRVFLRLQRVHSYLSSCCHLEIDNGALARMANYSVYHFIRAFRTVYGETPHAYLVRQRLDRARRLLYHSHLAIAEVARASGFENRCVFSRLFRERFGTTAGEIRRQIMPRRLGTFGAATA